jgi:hypothetical protein
MTLRHCLYDFSPRHTYSSSAVSYSFVNPNQRVAQAKRADLPADLGSGSYEFRDLTDIGVGSLFERLRDYSHTISPH